MTKKKKTSYTLNLGIFGTDAGVLYTQKSANLIQKALPADSNLVPLVNPSRSSIRELTNYFKKDWFFMRFGFRNYNGTFRWDTYSCV